MKKLFLLPAVALLLVGCFRGNGDEGLFGNPYSDLENVPENDLPDPPDPPDDPDDDGPGDGYIDFSRFIDDRPYFHYIGIYEPTFRPGSGQVEYPDVDWYFEYTFKQIIEHDHEELGYPESLPIGNGFVRVSELLKDRKATTKYYLGKGEELSVYSFTSQSTVAFTMNDLGALTYLKTAERTNQGLMTTVITVSYSR